VRVISASDRSVSRRSRISAFSEKVIGWLVPSGFTMDSNATGCPGPGRERAQDRTRGLRDRTDLFSVSLYMRAEVVERRQAVLSRLIVLRADGRLNGEVVCAAAESLGVGERSVWRWLAAGEHEPGKRSRWRMTPAAVEALYLAGGRPTAAWRLLSEEGVEVPSLPTFCRAVRRDVSPAERAYARHG
jgi:hypothetical protein